MGQSGITKDHDEESTYPFPPVDIDSEDEEEARLERKRLRRLERKALAERARATEEVADKAQPARKTIKKKAPTKMPPLVARPYKKWEDDKLNSIIAQVEGKISILDDKLQLYNIRLRRYVAERNWRDGDEH